MVRHTQTIRPQIIDELLEFLDHFMGLALHVLKEEELKILELE